MQTLAPLPQEQQRLSQGVFGGHEVKKRMKNYEERMEEEEEKLWKSGAYFLIYFYPCK